MVKRLDAFWTWSKSPMGTAVHALGITQIVAWGTTLYALGVLAHPIMADTGWSSSLVYGGLSLGLLVSGVTSTYVGQLIDRVGARGLMTWGALWNAVGLVLLTLVRNPWEYLAVWVLLGVSMRLTLYDAAFAALVQVTPERGRRAISYLTLYGGFASTVFWPVGHELATAFGWKNACLVFAALNVLVCMPLNWWGLMRTESEASEQHAADTAKQSSAESGKPEAVLAGRSRTIAMVLFSIATSAYAFIFGAASVHLVGLIETAGIATATAVSIASVKGLAQVGGRLWDIIFASNWAPMSLARVPIWLMPFAFICLFVLQSGIMPALIFTVLFGAANGLVTIVRGAVPLALFGPKGYGEVLGVLATPYLLINALAPVVFAMVIDWGGYEAGRWLLFAAALISLLAMEVLAYWYRKRPQS